MKRSETISLYQAFRDLMEEEPELYEHMLEEQALELLPKIFGSLYKYISEPSIKDAVLYLRTYSAAVKQGLLIDKMALVRRINDELGVELLRDLKLY